MAALKDSVIDGNLRVDGTVTATAGAGFSNYQIYNTATSGTWTLPAALQVVGTRFKVTVLGGGGAGGGTTVIASSSFFGAGGSSGGLGIVYLTYVSGQNTMAYVVGAGGTGVSGAAGNAGANSQVTYNALTYIGLGGTAGAVCTTTLNTSVAGGAPPGVGGTGTFTFSISGGRGTQGGGANGPVGPTGQGGKAPLCLSGSGCNWAGASIVQAGTAATGNGGGGGGAVSYSVSSAAQAGGAGSPGLILIEW